jgi:hypothetical protein
VLFSASTSDEDTVPWLPCSVSLKRFRRWTGDAPSLGQGRIPEHSTNSTGTVKFEAVPSMTFSGPLHIAQITPVVFMPSGYSHAPFVKVFSIITASSVPLSVWVRCTTYGTAFSSLSMTAYKSFGSTLLYPHVAGASCPPFHVDGKAVSKPRGFLVYGVGLSLGVSRERYAGQVSL